MTIAGGSIILASDISKIYVPLWTVPATAATSNITSEAIVATSPSATYPAGTAWEIKLSGIVNTISGTVTKANFVIRDTNIAGTQRLIEYGVTMNSLGNIGFDYEHVVANTTGADIVARVLVLTCTAAGSGTPTITVNAAANIPRVFKCTYAGLAVDHPDAVAL